MRPVDMFKTADEKAASKRQWEQAREAQLTYQKGNKLSSTSIEKTFPTIFGDVQEQWLTQTLQAVEYIKASLVIEKFDCEELIWELLIVNQKNM